MMQVATPQAVWRIAPSPIHGRGAFLVAPVPRGALIGKAQWYDGRGWNTTRLGQFHNHSVWPTAVSVTVREHFGSRYLYAARDLAAGEEITVDYRQQPDLEQPGVDWR